ncbi:autotransporter outer membrane beta-barrel domain-containing protein [Lysobacter sp. ESA13C]|uniref:autotransporter family protein n=1 Tax=Lysobacter sp. ESA13C TaxID=2862676 RepID=UPI001CBCEF42|nr:autotransporter outer membrane beta-barrel domain-containing protein [Lysobacter sp. ESA13C]
MKRLSTVCRSHPRHTLVLAIQLVLIGLPSAVSAQNVTVSGTNGRMGGDTCNVVFVPSQCATEVRSVLAPVNAPTWNHGGPQPVVLIGSNISNSNTGPAVSGSATITGGGIATTGRVRVGFEGNTTGTVTIAGAGSRWTASGIGVIGDYGNGSLTISDGGLFSSSNSYVGLNKGGVGNVLISGISAGGNRSTWESRNNSLYLGGSWFGDEPITRGGQATVQILDGGRATTTAGGVFVGQSVGSNTRLLVSGVHATGIASSLETSGQLAVGNYGAGVLEIANGGRAQSAQGFIGGARRTPASTSATQPDPTMGQGTVLISGINGATRSTWAVTSDLTVGNYASGTLDIADGGLVTSASGVIGQVAGSVGTATVSGKHVSGTPSEWSTGALVIGQDGNGTLNVVNEARVKASAVTVGAVAGSLGTVNIGTGSIAGSLDTPMITGGYSGAGVVNFNHTDAIQFSPKLTGELTVNQLNTGSTTLTESNDYRGPTTVSSGSLIAANTARFSPNSIHAISSGAVLDLNGYNQTVAGLNHGGDIRFGSTPGTTLTTTGNYVGNGGNLLINTVLADDASTTDRLVIGGNASGQGNVQVANVGGAGAATVEGIKLIQIDGASDAQFALQGRAIAGAYEYLLQKGGVSDPANGDWYLRSYIVQLPPPPVTPPVTPPIVPPGVPSPPSATPEQPLPEPTPVFRPEPGAYLANQSAAEAMFRHSLHDRLGEPNLAERLRSDDTLGSAWVRVVRNQTDYTAAEQLDVSSDSSMMQIGTDVLRWGNKGRGQLGFMLSSGQSHNHSKSGLTGYFAKGKVEGKALGLYGTWYADPTELTGLYVDAWLQYGSFENRLQGFGLSGEDYDSKSLSASVEAGYAWRVHDNGKSALFLEPQVQVVHSNFDSDSVVEANGTFVDSVQAGGLTTRLGLRAYGHASAPDGNRVQPFMTLNWWRRADSDEIAFNGQTLTSLLPRDRYEVKLGAEMQLGGGWTGWGHMAVETGAGDYRNIGGTVGVKYSW